MIILFIFLFAIRFPSFSYYTIFDHNNGIKWTKNLKSFTMIKVRKLMNEARLHDQPKYLGAQLEKGNSDSPGGPWAQEG